MILNVFTLNQKYITKLSFHINVTVLWQFYEYEWQIYDRFMKMYTLMRCFWFLKDTFVTDESLWQIYDIIMTVLWWINDSFFTNDSFITDLGHAYDSFITDLWHKYDNFEYVSMD